MCNATRNRVIPPSDCHRTGANGAAIPKPAWIRVPLPSGDSYNRLKTLMRSKTLNTVCEHALCPNVAECWGRGTATFLILGDICTRSCTFCAVRTGRPDSASPDRMEPVRLAEAALVMQLRHVVVTSVTRDDFPDGGASVFAETIRQLHTTLPDATVEVLIPDFKGNQPALRLVMDARPEILGHNVETVSRLYQRVRPQALYHRSLDTLRTAKKISPGALTKSGVMVGLGEDWDDLLMTMTDLRRVDCDILTIGQYLRPSKDHLPVSRYYTPEEFATLKEIGYNKGFRWVESGPFVRSSYHAEVQARELGNS